jgi:phenylalanyl-tRNA synthetase alpha chain
VSSSAGGAESLSLSEKKILSALSRLGGRASLAQISSVVGFRNPTELMNALNWLKAKGYVLVNEKVIRFYTLKEEARQRRLPERIVLEEIASAPVGLDELGRRLGDSDLVSVAVGWLRRRNWATIDSNRKLAITGEGRKALMKPGEDESILKELEEGEVEENENNRKILRELLSRRDFVREHDRIVREVSLREKGVQAVSEGLTFEEDVSLLSSELLKTEKWKGLRFRPYDIRAPVEVLAGPRRHPLLRTVDQVSTVFAEMGFTEIEDDVVQSAFWDMDALFTPQDHPARDMQDTFYLSNPSRGEIERRLASKIRSAHEHGGSTGSTGWGYSWSEEEASKMLLRTHTTVATIRYLAEHRKQPVKAFAVGRIFRHEAMDSTHLSEFHQIEGVLMEKRASFDMLCNVLSEFYRKMGFDRFRLRPGYFPYTEPSMEIDVLYNGRWMELGGSGMFRPEVLAPLGIRHPVLAWGLGLERLVMIKYGFSDIRKLYLSDLSALQKMPVL